MPTPVEHTPQKPQPDSTPVIKVPDDSSSLSSDEAKPKDEKELLK